MNVIIKLSKSNAEIQCRISCKLHVSMSNSLTLESEIACESTLRYATLKVVDEEHN